MQVINEFNIIGDKLLLIWALSYNFKLNYKSHGNIWRKMSWYNKQVKYPRLQA